jgi:hypothetical protein
MARCAYCHAPVESCFAGHGAMTDELVAGLSFEWCARCRRTTPALLGRMHPAEVIAATVQQRDARWSVN